ncbi:MAG: hypothetical protein ABEJ84_04005 [Halodesulfurarchaeum sp.]
MFTAWGRLRAITSFASLAFIVVFGSVSVLAYKHRDHEAINPVPPAIGAIGTFVFAPVMFFNLYHRNPGTFWMVLAIAAIVIGLELLYFERDRLPEEVIGVGKTLEGDLEAVEHDLDELTEDLQTLEESDRPKEE